MFSFRISYDALSEYLHASVSNVSLSEKIAWQKTTTLKNKYISTRDKLLFSDTSIISIIFYETYSGMISRDFSTKAYASLFGM